MNLFAYGTLMWPEVLKSVIGRALNGRPATLDGFWRVCVKGEHYPAIIPSDDDEVGGVLYEGLSEAEFRYLDRFEGEEYDRVAVCIDAVQAEVYVLSRAWMHLADIRSWRPEDMQSEHLEAFRSEYKGWRNI